MAKHTRDRRGSVKKRGPWHKRIVWAVGLFLFLFLLVAGTRFLGDRLYQFPENEIIEALPKDAVIVCLAGGKGRIEAAVNLYAQGVGSGLYVIGAGKKSTIGSIIRRHVSENVANTISVQRIAKIQVETESRNTMENAFAVNRLIQQAPEVKTIILVTAGYHMRRAQFMIENQLHREIKIIPFTPSREFIDRDAWWQNWIGIEVTMQEYFKFVMMTVLVPKLEYF